MSHLVQTTFPLSTHQRLSEMMPHLTHGSRLFCGYDFTRLKNRQLFVLTSPKFFSPNPTIHSLPSIPTARSSADSGQNSGRKGHHVLLHADLKPPGNATSIAANISAMFIIIITRGHYPKERARSAKRIAWRNTVD